MLNDKIVFLGENANKPQILNCDMKLSTLQKLVGGYIEVINVGKYLIVVDENGKIKSRPVNILFKGNNIFVNDFIVGNIVICSSDGEEMIGLTSEDINKIKKMGVY